MSSPIKIFIVEDEMIIAANISLQLSKLGYEVTGIAVRGEEAMLHIKENNPDIVLMDIQLKGKLDGIQTVQLIQKEYKIPIIYLTASIDNDHFNRAKATNPYAFISKPFKKLDLQRAIELTVNYIMKNETSIVDKCISPFVLNDCIFVKRNDKIEAERNYCRIFSKERECLLVMTLKDIDIKLPDEHFLRIHRSYIVNLSHIDEVSNSHVVITQKAIPLSKSFRGELLNRLQTV
jgi:DNA-binding LytR/AlgR family response regulator